MKFNNTFHFYVYTNFVCILCDFRFPPRSRRFGTTWRSHLQWSRNPNFCLHFAHQIKNILVLQVLDVIKKTSWLLHFKGRYEKYINNMYFVRAIITCTIRYCHNPSHAGIPRILSVRPTIWKWKGGHPNFKHNQI